MCGAVCPAKRTHIYIYSKYANTRSTVLPG
jgi:hypothetical protein